MRTFVALWVLASMSSFTCGANELPRVSTVQSLSDEDVIRSALDNIDISENKDKVVEETEKDLLRLPEDRRREILDKLKRLKSGRFREVHVDLNAITLDAARDDPPCGIEIQGGTFPLRYAACEKLCIGTLEGQKITSVKLLAGNGEYAHSSQAQECSPGKTCPIGWAKFWTAPEFSENGTKVCSNFKNWSSTYVRHAIIEIGFD